jgi:hypothetical protein
MDSMRSWIVVDSRPVVHVLDHRTLETEYSVSHHRIRKRKKDEKMFLIELHYAQLLAIGFERNVFLLSLAKKEVISEIRGLKSSITSLVFSEFCQALFVSTYEMHFKGYEMVEWRELKEKGIF